MLSLSFVFQDVSIFHYKALRSHESAIISTIRSQLQQIEENEVKYPALGQSVSQKIRRSISQ